MDAGLLTSRTRPAGLRFTYARFRDPAENRKCPLKVARVRGGRQRTGAVLPSRSSDDRRGGDARTVVHGGTPRVLFEGQYPPPYNIAPDGRFLMVRDEQPADAHNSGCAELGQELKGALAAK